MYSCRCRRQVPSSSWRPSHASALNISSDSRPSRHRYRPPATRTCSRKIPASGETNSSWMLHQITIRFVLAMTLSSGRTHRQFFARSPSHRCLRFVFPIIQCRMQSGPSLPTGNQSKPGEENGEEAAYVRFWLSVEPPPLYRFLSHSLR